MVKLCKCGKESKTGRCKSCSNKERKIISMNRPKGLKYNWKNKIFNEKNPMWRGDKVKIFALHSWIKRRKPKSELCEECKKNRPYDLANISGEYNRDINNYKWLCRRCHMKEDGRINNLKRGGKEKGIQIRKICLCCKKEYYVTPSKEKRSKFCCRNCKNKYQRKCKNGK